MTTLGDCAADLHAVTERLKGRFPDADPAFERRLRAEFPRLHGLFQSLYGEHPDGREALGDLVLLSAASHRDRPVSLRTLDARREADPGWFLSERMLGGVCYVDLYAGTLDGVRERIPYFTELGLTYLHLMPLFARPEGANDGGYAISDYRRIHPPLGTMHDLEVLAEELRETGISLVVDFVFNHTSDEHEWARRAVERDPIYEDFYLIFPDRTMPDAYEKTTREVFPDDHAGSFVQLDDGRWVWATFYGFQWDLNYANPAVFSAMAGEMLFLANRGVEVLRMDAVAFIWKRLGTPCESLPEAHLLLQAFNAVMRMAAPAVLFKSEAIVHPDEVVDYISPGECQLSYNPLQMALTWEALATRDARMLQQALDRRHDLPVGTSWVNYVRGHDDIGWTFADEDAAEFDIDGAAHRRFLNAFYTGRYPASFARGMPFQENPQTGDARVTGATASLAGVEADDDGGEDRLVLAHALAFATGGIPLIYLGDEVAQQNDYGFVDDPDRRDDSRWVNRPARPDAAYGARTDPATVAGRVFARLSRLAQVRRNIAEFGGNTLFPFHAGPASVVGFQRLDPDRPASRILVLANVADAAEQIDPVRFSGFAPEAEDLVAGGAKWLDRGLELPPHGFVWLRVRAN